MSADNPAMKRPAPYRIADLVRKTGITKETIHYYITEGLLPKAKKTSKNMAWYGDEHVQRLKTIKELQEKQFLPLKAIKAVLTDAKDYAFTPGQQRTLEGLQRMLLQREATGETQDIELAEAQTRHRISDQEIAEMESVNVLTVDRSGKTPRIEADDEKLLELWARLRDLGFSRERGFKPVEMEAYESVAALMFDQGVRIMAEHLEQLDPEEAARMMDEALPSVAELVGHFHAKKVRKFLTTFNTKS